MEILIVDDDSQCLDDIEFALLPSNYNSTKVSSPKKAIELLRIKKFEAVIIDINMPEINGIALMEFLKENNIDSKVIIITGHPDMENAIKAANHKVYGFFVKPIEFSQLVVKLREIEFEHTDRIIIEKLIFENKKLIDDYQNLISNLNVNLKNSLNEKLISSYEKLCRLLFLETYDYFKQRLQETISKIIVH
jgi:DNA-binding NtrC family response regulator